jgi:phospholipid/cholesterol/gamma-HCH transport system substrate-binding protein
MEPEAKYTYVGAALLVLIAATVAGILWLQDVGARRDFNYYSIYFENQALDGLQVGADVNVRGIKVGRVEDYALTENANRVHVTVRVDRRTPVSENTHALVTRNLVTGIATINLVTPARAGPPLVNVPPGEPYPVIAEGDSNLDGLTGKFTQIGDLAAEAINNFNRAFRAENREALTAAMQNLRQLAEGLNQRLAKLDRSLAAFDAAAASIARAGDRVTAVSLSAERQLEPTLVQAERTLRDVSAAAQTLQKETAQLSQRIDRAASSTDDQLAVVALELRETVNALNRALERFHDPSAALLGPSRAQLGPGEKNP